MSDWRSVQIYLHKCCGTHLEPVPHQKKRRQILSVLFLQNFSIRHKVMRVVTTSTGLLKGLCHAIFDSCFFHVSVSLSVAFSRLGFPKIDVMVLNIL